LASFRAQFSRAGFHIGVCQEAQQTFEVQPFEDADGPQGYPEGPGAQAEARGDILQEQVRQYFILHPFGAVLNSHTFSFPRFLHHRMKSKHTHELNVAMRDLEQGSHLIEAPTSLRAKTPVTISVPATSTVHTKSKSTSSKKGKSNDDMDL
jgi:hypothetical protein